MEHHLPKKIMDFAPKANRYVEKMRLIAELLKAGSIDVLRIFERRFV